METLFDRLVSIKPYFSFIFERCLFNLADQFVPAYRGGNWKSKDIGNDTLTLVYPSDDKVEIFNTISGATAETDPVSAGVSLTVIALNMLVEKVYGHSPDEQVAQIVDMMDAIKDAAFSNETLDKRSIFRIID